MLLAYSKSIPRRVPQIPRLASAQRPIKRLNPKWLSHWLPKRELYLLIRTNQTSTLNLIPTLVPVSLRVRVRISDSSSIPKSRRFLTLHTSVPPSWLLSYSSCCSFTPHLSLGCPYQRFRSQKPFFVGTRAYGKTHPLTAFPT